MYVNVRLLTDDLSLSFSVYFSLSFHFLNSANWLYNQNKWYPIHAPSVALDLASSGMPDMSQLAGWVLARTQFALECSSSLQRVATGHPCLHQRLEFCVLNIRHQVESVDTRSHHVMSHGHQVCTKPGLESWCLRERSVPRTNDVHGR